MPEQVHVENRSILGSLPVFSDESLVDWEGKLTEDLAVTITPFVPDGTLDLSAGEVAAPAPIVIPAAGIVHRYPFDSYEVRETGPTLIRGSVSRAESTKAIAILLLALMVGLAVIAVAAVKSAARGRMKLELPLASWLTVMLFALIPIRSFFPGAPPRGSWMDILVVFWVEMVLIVCVGHVSWATIVRAGEASATPGPT